MQEEQGIEEMTITQKVAVIQPIQLAGEPEDKPSQSMTEKPGKNGVPLQNSVVIHSTLADDPPAEGSSFDVILPAIETPLPEVLPSRRAALPPQKRDQDAVVARVLRERCRQLCLSLFMRSHDPIRSLGVTSAVPGEGKTFLAQVAASVLSRDCQAPVILLECNWEHPNLHEHFGLAATPGLAEWLRGECSVSAISHRIDDNLSVILAGDARGQAVRLLRQMRTRGLIDTIARDGEAVIVDLPPIIVSGYGTLAAELVESLIVVVRAGVTPDVMIAEVCNQLKDLPVHGLMLNQLQSKIPRWIRQLL